jgi:NAD(P)-dependent dehydrogenase (short-subunit alcohol dehydrogenase family)
MSVNLRGAFFLIQECTRRMLSSPGETYRSIHVVTSVSAEIVSPDRAEYCISKAGASMMTKGACRAPGARRHRRVRAAPRHHPTPMTGPVADRYDARIAEGLVPSGRWGEPSDIGKVIVPLARGDFDFATGAVIPVDGGLSIHRL